MALREEYYLCFHFILVIRRAPFSIISVDQIFQVARQPRRDGLLLPRGRADPRIPQHPDPTLGTWVLGAPVGCSPHLAACPTGVQGLWLSSDAQEHNGCCLHWGQGQAGCLHQDTHPPTLSSNRRRQGTHRPPGRSRARCWHLQAPAAQSARAAEALKPLPWVLGSGKV